jgi:hypothetical protein
MFMKLVKRHEEQKVAPEVAVAATRKLILLALQFFSFSFLFCTISYAAILPEERADVLYHSYDGGGVTIDGPSVLVRKNFNEKFSISGNYYVDMVTSASIDVLATASEYEEERTEYSLGLDYLNDRTIMSLGFANSTENDYEADTVSFSISQEFFGDLSTLTMGFILGDDTVMANGAPDFEESLDRKRFNLGFSQILSKSFIASFSYESIIDEGFLNNPYRQVRVVAPVINPGDRGFDYIPERYPNTRNSEAFALRGIYALNPESSIRAEYRLFSDNWGVESNNAELRYTRKFGDKWLFEFRARQYQQTSGADFFQDLFDFSVETPEFLARDKELSEYSSQQFGFSATYTFKSSNSFINNSTLNFSWDAITFDYDTFRDATVTDPANGIFAGSEPLYSLDADVIRIFYSVYF